MARKKQSVVSAERVAMAIQTRFDPIPTLTPEKLVQYHQAFQRGYLRDAVLTWEQIRRLDDKCISVIPKFEKSVSRYGYEFVTSEGFEKDARAEKHRKTLAFFYDNLVVTDAMDLNVRGGVPLLIRQMVRAIGNVYNVHEMWFTPRPGGLTAEIRNVPLQFFENTTGRLRFLPSDFSIVGVAIEPGEWLITVGDGLMPATACAYTMKHLSLRDWLVYCGKHAATGIHGVTDAAVGTAEWQKLEEAVRYFSIDLAMVTNKGAEIKPIDVSVKGELPWPKLVDVMDRAIATIWRGGDLSTMSSGPQAVGASVQGDESDILEQDASAVVTDTLNEQLDRWIIRYVHGEEPLAWIRIKTSARKDVKADIEIDRFLISEAGLPQGKKQLAARYGRTLPDADDELVVPPAKAAPPPFTAANERSDSTKAADDAAAGQLLAEARMRLATAQHKALEPVGKALTAIYKRAEAEDWDAEQLAEALARFRDEELPKLALQVMADDGTTQVFEELLSAAIANGMEEGAAEVKA